MTGELIALRVVGDDIWAIGNVRTDDGTITAVGKFLGAKVGDTVELDGHWDTHPRYGPQYKFKTCRVSLPKTDVGVVLWMASRLPNLGEKRAREMLEHFGSAELLWSVIEYDPERLAEIKGITVERAEEIAVVYADFLHERDRMILFRTWGLTENQIGRVLTAWGKDSEERIKSNPYSLAEVVDGFGFLRADKVARRMGIAHDSAHRVQAGIAHTLGVAVGYGNCYMPTGKLVNLAATKVLKLPEELVAKHVKIMRKRGDYVQRGARTFPRRLDRQEEHCADIIAELLHTRPWDEDDAESATSHCGESEDFA